MASTFRRILSTQFAKRIREQGIHGFTLPKVYDPTSGRPFYGANRLRLGLDMELKGFTDPRWMTMRQTNACGRTVEAGSKASFTEYWNVVNTKHLHSVDADPDDPEQFTVTKDITPKAVTVFNFQQIDQESDDLPPRADDIDLMAALAAIAEKLGERHLEAFEWVKSYSDIFDGPEQTAYECIEEMLKVSSQIQEDDPQGGHRLSKHTGHQLGIHELTVQLSTALIASELGLDHEQITPFTGNEEFQEIAENEEARLHEVLTLIASEDHHELARIIRSAEKLADAGGFRMLAAEHGNVPMPTVSEFDSDKYGWPPELANSSRSILTVLQQSNELEPNPEAGDNDPVVQEPAQPEEEKAVVHAADDLEPTLSSLGIDDNESLFEGADLIVEPEEIVIEAGHVPDLSIEKISDIFYGHAMAKLNANIQRRVDLSLFEDEAEYLEEKHTAGHAKAMTMSERDYATLAYYVHEVLAMPVIKKAVTDPESDFLNECKSAGRPTFLFYCACDTVAQKYDVGNRDIFRDTEKGYTDDQIRTAMKRIIKHTDFDYLFEENENAVAQARQRQADLAQDFALEPL